MVVMDVGVLGQDRTDEEWETMLKRETTLLKMGLSGVEAFVLAVRCMYRDRPDSGDDRTLCLECQHAKRKQARCTKAQVYLPFVLQRCDLFLKVAA